jgi:hypothetical protein
MALGDTGGAIGAVTQLLHDRLLASAAAPVVNISVGRPEPGTDSPANPRLNIFLYEIQFDGHLRNLPLDEGQPAPLWLVLRYLLTAYDGDGDSDTVIAHQILGDGMRILQDLNFFSLAGLPAATIAALDDNPDKLKLTFESSDSDLLSKLMQGADEKYRCSVGFQVRPVMIASREPADYALLVGVDYQADAVIGEAGIQLPVLPSLGPSLTSLTPPSAEVGDSLTLTGADLHLSDLVIQFGPVELPITTQRTNRITCELIAALADGTAISAGNHPVTVAQALPSGRRRHSNMLVGGLKPRLDTAVPGALALTAEGWITGTIELTGSLLGTDQDDVFVALYRDGAVVRTFDVFVRPVAPPPQIQMQLQITAGAQVPPGAYRVILRVNGQQARTSPEILLVGP